MLNAMQYGTILNAAGGIIQFTPFLLSHTPQGPLEICRTFLGSPDKYDKKQIASLRFEV